MNAYNSNKIPNPDHQTCGSDRNSTCSLTKKGHAPNLCWICIISSFFFNINRNHHYHIQGTTRESANN